jgi:hypothetical protein
VLNLINSNYLHAHVATVVERWVNKRNHLNYRNNYRHFGGLQCMS